jgi:hypothetical protein
MKKFCLLIVLSLMFVLSLLSYCIAAEAAAVPNPFGDALTTLLTNVIFPFFGALTLGVVTWAAKKIGNKFKIETLAQDNNFLTSIAAQGIAFAEEKAANFAKNAQPLTGNDKLNSAIAYVMQMAPKVSEAQAQSLVTAALAMLPGVGATGTTAVGTPTPAIVPTPAVPLSVPFSTDPLTVAPA